jgi:hypothetical protein
MNYPTYELKASSDSTIFEFVSYGIQGNIYKVIKFSVTKNADIINLGFGNKININDKNGSFDIDDVNITDNGDRDVILATVASATYIYTKLYPNKFIFFSGSCEVRTRLYRMVISINYEELIETFLIFGILQNPETGKYYNVTFNNSTNFIAFLIKRRKL